MKKSEQLTKYRENTMSLINIYIFSHIYNFCNKNKTINQSFLKKLIVYYLVLISDYLWLFMTTIDII